MPIEIVCRGCQAHYRVKDELAGRVAVCKHCGGKIRIPMAGPVGPVTLDDDAESAPPPVVKSPVARPAGATSHGTGHGTGHGTSHGTRMAATRMGTTAGAAGLGNGEGDDDEAALRAAADAERDFHEYGIHKQDMPRDTKRFVPKNESFLPPIVGELWMPLAVVVFCYGLTLTMAITRMLGSYAPLPGLLLVGAAVLAFVAGVIPMTIRAVTGASDTLDFKLPNAVWLQTAAAIGPATLGATLGLFTVGGAFGTLLGAGIGMGLAVPMMLAMYGVTPLQAVQTALLTALMYGMGMAGVAGLTAALGLFFFPLWNMQRPWEPAKPKDLAANTAATRPALAPVVEAAPTTAPVVEAPAPAPAVASTAPAAPAPPPRPAWAAAVDAAPPLRWPASVFHTVDVQPPVKVLTTPAPSPFVTLIDSDSCDTYDLRSGRRLGQLRQRLYGDMLLSPGGKFLIIRGAGNDPHAPLRRPAFSQGLSPAGVPVAPAPQPREGDIYSMVDGRLITRIVGASGAKVIGFAGDEKLLLSGNTDAGQPGVQVFDVPSGQPLSKFEADGTGTCAISATGRYLASMGTGITTDVRVYDVETGKLMGALELPLGATAVKTMAFSPTGTALAALVATDALEPPRLVVWDLIGGAQTQSFPLAPHALAAPAAVAAPVPMSSRVASAAPAASPSRSADMIAWLPDGMGFVIGNQMIDRASGKPFQSLASPPIAGSAGRLVAAISNYAAVYQYDPATTGTAAGRMIFKSAPAGAKGETDKLLAALRGPGWTPQEVQASAAAPATGAAMVASATPGAPTTAAAAAAAAALAAAPAAGQLTPAQLAAQKQWLVNVVVVRKADLAAIDEQIRAENAKLPEIERRHAAAKERSDELERASDTVTDRFGNTRRVQRNSERVIGEARVAVDRVVDEKRKLKQRVARLEREKVTAASTRTIVGKLDDGTAVQVDVDAPAMIALADELATGVKYNVAGVGRIVEGVLRVKPRTIVPAE